jgi:hypothetical protein
VFLVAYEVDFGGFTVDDIEVMKPKNEKKSMPQIKVADAPVIEKKSNGVELKQFRDCRQAIIDYLNAALQDKPSVVLTLSKMRSDIGMNQKTLFKHLKSLRQTHFTLKNLGYGTEVSRRE